jgi:hypothetical protein
LSSLGNFFEGDQGPSEEVLPEILFLMDWRFSKISNENQQTLHEEVSLFS